MGIGEIVQLSFIYLSALGAPIFLFSVVACSEEIVKLIRKSISPSYMRY